MVKKTELSLVIVMIVSTCKMAKVHYTKSRKAFKGCEFENYKIKLKLTFLLFCCERFKVVSDHFVTMRKHVLDPSYDVRF